MKISPGIVGQSSTGTVAVDKRWLMAYNAALGEVSAAPHPLFPVCYEWPSNTVLREVTGLQALNARLVHAQHDVTLHRAIREEMLSVSGKVIAVAQRRPGAFVVMRMETRGAGGDHVSTSDYGMLYRSVTLDGGDRAIEPVEDPLPGKGLEKIGEIGIAPTAAHVYTECARIWNPIHTDPEYARGAGLPGIILHGTATLAFSVSKVMEKMKVTARRVRCRFAGMVLMPTELTVFASRQGSSVAFETRSARGEAVIERGWIIG
ncbi:MAG TPA: MaoC/PaaZ C-terminal domain-containing protein [Burkholderiales bacterium]|nr:MaoC/PaaZ C-terminal domain-containing protein [Burkholderiales bacterium]